MLKLTVAAALALGLVVAAGSAGAQTAPPKVCKNVFGKVVACPPPKPGLTMKPGAPAPKPGLLSHLTLNHPAGPAPAAPAPMHPAPGAPPAPQHAAPPAPQHAAPPAVQHGPAPGAPVKPGVATGGASQSMRAGASAQCKDGTYWRSKSHSGSCAHHGGVSTFFS